MTSLKESIDQTLARSGLGRGSAVGERPEHGDLLLEVLEVCRDLDVRLHEAGFDVGASIRRAVYALHNEAREALAAGLHEAHAPRGVPTWKIRRDP